MDRTDTAGLLILGDGCKLRLVHLDRELGACVMLDCTNQRTDTEV